MVTRGQTVALSDTRRTDHVPVHRIENTTRPAFDGTHPGHLLGCRGSLLPGGRVDDDCVHADRTVPQRAIWRFRIGESHGRVIVVRLSNLELGPIISTWKAQTKDKSVRDSPEWVKRTRVRSDPVAG